jgi:hypothetical protein
VCRRPRALQPLTGDAPGFGKAPDAGIFKNGVDFSLERSSVCLCSSLQLLQDAIVCLANYKMLNDSQVAQS